MDKEKLKHLLLENSTKKYHFQYQDFFYNHISQGTIALNDLGASRERIERFIDWMKPKLELASTWLDKEVKARIKTHEEIHYDQSHDEFMELRGKRKEFYFILAYYRSLYTDKYQGNIQSLVKEEYPKLIDGFASGALHGTIQVGYGLHTECDELVLEGLAFTHFSFIPFEIEKSQSQEWKGGCDPLSVLRDVRNDSSLRGRMLEEFKKDYIQQGPKGFFGRRLRALLTTGGAKIIQYVHLLALPENDDDARSTRIRQLAAWQVELALRVYASAEARNDFFLLHGVTGAWGLKHILPLLEYADAIAYVERYLCTLIAVYVVEDSPALNREVDATPPEQKFWEDIRAEVLKDDFDEHIYKLVQVAMDVFRANEKHGAICRQAALTALTHPLTYGSGRPQTKIETGGNL